MFDADDTSYVCKRCGSAVEVDDDFCAHCGEIFADEVSCRNHPETPASGVCVICTLPLCASCGGMVNNSFLCEEHCTCEIYQGMVRVYGVLDDLSAQYAKSCLEQAGLHPILYCRSQPRGGPRFVYTLYEAGGDYDGHIVNEVKVMVPCQEFRDAEQVLISLDLKRASPASDVRGSV